MSRLHDTAVADAEADHTRGAGLHPYVTELSCSWRLLEAEQGTEGELTWLLPDHPDRVESRRMPTVRPVAGACAGAGRALIRGCGAVAAGRSRRTAERASATGPSVADSRRAVLGGRP
ncbi:hypothetical protein CQW44_35285 [Streptomyces griseofuscus]|uniref:Uncharacterized protein n=1 Tax=Streptomyces griseofuscus TaxID=146922 RepID=A0A426RWX8_9ACTN|nr:hypothetical protein CQW44_35285 [Streptomyces griseofuscus]